MNLTHPSPSTDQSGHKNRLAPLLPLAVLLLMAVAVLPDLSDRRMQLPVFSDQLDAYAEWEAKEYHLAQVWAGITAARTPAQLDAVLIHAKEALRRGPANGYAWLALAWAHEIAEQHDVATDALLQSWHHAPHLRNLARARVFLALPRWPQLSMHHRQLLLEDVNLLRQADAQAFIALRAGHPRLNTLWSLARVQIANRLNPLSANQI